MFTNRTVYTRLAAVAATAGLALALSACGGDSDASEDTAPDTGAEETNGTDDGGTDEATGPFGPACSDIPETGDGSFDGMADDPVATAAANNPELETLVAAVEAAELGDTLNSASDITVFAPVNSAFEAIPEEDLNAVLEDQELLTTILTYHVVDQAVTPEQLGTEGPFTTLQGEDIEVTGSGEDFTVNGEAAVVCGNVQTANATVYLIDSVLMPAME